MSSVVVAPIDFSEDSLQGARVANAIALSSEASLALLHVDGLPVYTQQVAQAAAPEAWVEYLADRDRALEERLRQFAAPLERRGPGQLPIEVRLARGDAAKAIVEVAAMQGTDLVVISPHGSGHGQRFLLGSVSAQVATSAKCPVLVARSRQGAVASANARFAEPLLAVSDVGLAEGALALTMRLAEPGTCIHLMHVLEAWEIAVGIPMPGRFDDVLQKTRAGMIERLQRLAAPAEQAGFKVSVRVETGDPSFSILCRVESNPNGLVVVSRKAPSAGGHALATPAYRLVKHAPVPVLVVPGTPTRP